MRTIKFRGKRLDNGEWVYGSLLQGENQCVIATVKGDSVNVHECFEVAPASVGQFTGMLDSNGKEIYEGDILSDGEVKYEVWYSEDRAGFIAEMRDPQNDLVDYLGGYDTERMMTVIGNIHDNKLLNEK